MTKARNKTGREHCAACDDTGWVELAGTITTGGHTYSRGMAPCKWCEWGLHHFQHHPHLESDYTGADITPADQGHGRPFKPDTTFLRERAAAGDTIPAMQAMFPATIWPPEWPSPVTKPDPLHDDEAAETAEKVEIARRELETAQQEPISAPPPSSRDLRHAESEPDIELQDVPF